MPTLAIGLRTLVSRWDSDAASTINAAAADVLALGICGDLSRNFTDARSSDAASAKTPMR
jgi:hypothetical protein